MKSSGMALMLSAAMMFSKCGVCAAEAAAEELTSEVTPEQEGEVSEEVSAEYTPAAGEEASLPEGNGAEGTPAAGEEASSPEENGVEGTPAAGEEASSPEENGAEGTPAAGEEASLPEENGAEASSAISKEETVYVKAAADGNPVRVIVSDWLKGIDEKTGELSDLTTLTDIENVKGDEIPVQEGNGLIWPTVGKDIFYQGNTDKELPVSITLRYFLDGEEIKADEMAGKSGHVRIEVSYENHTGVTKVIEGNEESLVSPFIMLTAMILPDDCFHNITVEHGRAVSDSSRSIVVGLGMPGANENLGISEDEEMGIVLPEGFALEADTDNFTLGGTLTVALADLSGLIDAEDQIGDVEGKFDKVTGMLGTAESLLQGAGSISDSLQDDIIGPANQLMKDGEELQDKLTAIAGEIKSAKKTLKEQAQENLDSAVSEVNAQIDERNAEFAQKAEELQTQVNGELASARKALTEQIDVLTAENSKENEKAIAALKAAEDALQDVAAEPGTGVDHVSVPEISAPDMNLDITGFSLLMLKIGLEYAGIKNSAGTMLTEVDTMKTELDSLMAEGSGGMLQILEDMLTRAREIAADANHYDNFSGKAEGMPGSVKFIIETDPIG